MKSLQNIIGQHEDGVYIPNGTWYVTNDEGIVLFAGPRSKAEMAYRKAGGERSGNHLYKSLQDMPDETMNEEAK